MEFVFDDEKNARLILTRGISFEDVVEAISAGALLQVFENPNQVAYPGQSLMVVRIRDYPYCVPVDVRGDVFHLRTVYPCRKFKHMLEGEADGR